MIPPCHPSDPRAQDDPHNRDMTFGLAGAALVCLIYLAYQAGAKLAEVLS